MSVIEVREMVKVYGGVRAVDGISLEVEPGETFGILGRNGAGKTTLVETIAGLRLPDSGHIRVLGLDPGTDGHELKRRLGVQLQEGRLPDKIKVWEALDLYASFYESSVDWKALLDRLGLGDKMDAAYSSLSGGQKQRVSVALALVGDPEVVILDELTTGLDPQARRDTWEMIRDLKERGVTVVLVTHFMEEAERLADRVAVIDAGRIVALDSPGGLVASVGGEQVIRFRPSEPLSESWFSELPDVSAVHFENTQVVLTGGNDLLYNLISRLHHNQVTARELRVEQATLEDAFLSLTGSPIESSPLGEDQ